MMQYKYIFDISARFILGGVLLIAGSSKMLVISDFIETINSFEIIPNIFINTFALLLCLSEIMIGIMLLLNIYPKLTSLICGLYFVIFILFVSYSIIGNKYWICKCFGSLFGGKIDYTTLLRNIMFLILTIYAYYNPSKICTLDKFKKINGNRLIYFVMLYMVGISVLAYNDLKNAKPLTVGDQFANFKMLSINGDSINATIRKEPLLLITVFTMNDCSSCLDEAFFWSKTAKEYRGKLMVIGLTDEQKPIRLRAFLKHKSIEFPIVVDKDKYIINKYRLATPFKMLVDQNNRILKIERSLGSENNWTNFTNYINNVLKK